MSRPVKLIMCAVALSAGGGAALAAAAPGSAPARGDSRMIVCPLEPSATVTFPCCGPPIVTAASSYVVPCCDTPQADQLSGRAHAVLVAQAVDGRSEGHDHRPVAW